MQRFYVKSDLLGEKKYSIYNIDIFYQLIKVMRAKNGDKIVLFNCIESLDYIYEIREIRKREIIVSFVEKIEKDTEINFELVLYQAVSNKIEKVEYILQKCVEVGFKKIVFFKSSRSQKLNISENKIIRFKKIIIESVEQSDRNIIPELVFEEKIDFNIKGNNLFFHIKNNNSKSLKGIKLDFTQLVNLFVGPEGGWDENEIKNFEKNKFQKLNLGNRILRTETVGIVVGFWIIQII